MATISTVPDRTDGEVLTAAKYNSDHDIHDTNDANLNADIATHTTQISDLDSGKLESPLTTTLDVDSNGLDNVRNITVEDFVVLKEFTTPDTAAANTIRLAGVQTDGVTELVAVDESGNAVHITRGGSVGIPSGKSIIFAETTVPVGWNLVTTWNDRVIRIINTAAGGAVVTSGDASINGGSVNTSFAGAHTHDVNPHSHDLANRSLSAPDGGTTTRTDFLAFSTFAATSDTSSTGDHPHLVEYNIKHADFIVCSKD